MNKNKKRTKIMVFGTFDGLHEGHLDFFRQARALAECPYLIVSIARDENVKRIKNRRPQLAEEDRLNLVRRCGLVDRVVLGGKEEHIKHIKDEDPDIIALGYDQVAYTQDLAEDFKKNEINARIIRMKPYKENIFKNHLLKPE